MELVVLVVLALALGLSLHLAARNANLLACIKVTQGRAELVRGRLPPRLWYEIADVVQRNPTASATIRLVVNRGQARVLASGVHDDTVQQLRNAVGQHPLSQLRKGAKLARRSRPG